MIDLKKAKLPKAVKVDGSFFAIHTSFKYWLRFTELMSNKNTPPQEFDFMYIDEKPKSRLNGVIALLDFCNPPHLLPRTISGEDTGLKVLDYTLDADYIYSAFLERYRIDLVESKMHWYKFSALLRGLHDTKLNEIISFRSWENTSGKRDSYTRHMEKLRQAWELPQDENDEDDEDLKVFEAMLNKRS